MEEKERYEVISPSLNGYAYIHDFKTDNVLNTYDSCDLLNQQSKRIKELEKKLSEYLVDNTPIEKTQCPKPMPYVNKCEGRSFNTGKSHHIGRVYSQWDLKGEYNDSIQELTLTDSTAN